MIVIVVFILRSQRDSQAKLKVAQSNDKLYDYVQDMLQPQCRGVECFIEANNRPRRDQYCSRTMYPGSEGEHFAHHDDFELQNLVITIRDRSSIHSLPNANKQNILPIHY